MRKNDYGGRAAKNSGAFQNIKDVLVQTYDNIEQLHNRKGDITGIPTGFIELDRMTAGFQRNDLIIVAARPSVGKNGVCLKYCAKRGHQNG